MYIPEGKKVQQHDLVDHSLSPVQQHVDGIRTFKYFKHYDTSLKMCIVYNFHYNEFI